MNPDLTYQPQSQYDQNALSEKDGVLEVIPALSLDLPDKYIIQTLHTTIDKSNDYWNDSQGYNLKRKRERNMDMLEGNQLKGITLYLHQTRFIDNELYVGIDAIDAYVTANTPRSEVYPAMEGPDDIESKTFATDLEKYISSYCDTMNIADEFDSATYDAQSQYVGALKLWYDHNYGKHGEVITEAIDPQHLIIDKDAKRGGNPRFICHVLKDTVEGLIAKFPDKEKDIMRVLAMQRKGAQNISAEIAYREVWFTYFDKDNKPQEAVAWYMQNLVLDKRKNPNWLYGDEGENFLDNPMKPFVLINVKNNGKKAIDKTSALEQAIPQQEILNKLGRQIIDNLGTANGFKAMDAQFMTKDDAENLTGDPHQTIVGKVPVGKSIQDVIMQLPPQLVSEQLISQVQQCIQTIHNILGSPDQFRGNNQNTTQTATQDQQIEDQASGRQDKTVRAVERAATQYFNLLTQMFLVWYDDKHYANVNGGDGSFDRIELHKASINPSSSIRVAEGSMLKNDKNQQGKDADAAAELEFLAPYDYFVMKKFPNPQKLYDNLVKWKTNAMQLVMDNAADEADRTAIIDFTELMAGKKVEPRSNPTTDYIEQIRKSMITDEFLDAKKPIQKTVIAFVQQAVESLALRQELDQLSKPQGEPEPQVPLPPAVAQTIPPQPPMPVPMAGMPMGQPGLPAPGMPPQGAPMPMAPAPAPMMAPQSPIGSIMQGQPVPPMPGGMPPQPMQPPGQIPGL